MTASELINSEKSELVKILECYLAGACSHSTVQEKINQIFNKWEMVTDKESTYQKHEETFWCAVWTSQHLASEDHWQNGITQKDLPTIVRLLKENSELPNGWSGKRP